MGAKVASADGEIARIAARQHGVISIGQMCDTGMSRNMVRRRVEAARLHRVHRGVYAVGHPGLSPQGRWMAAVLACGNRDSGASGDRMGTTTILGHWGAALSYRSAAVHWGLLRLADGPVDVSVRGDGGRAKRPGIRLHRSLSLLPAAVTIRDGIPVTTPARTSADLRRVVSTPGKQGLISPWELRRAVRQANVLGLPIDEEANRDRTRSDLERDFLRLCRRHGLPAPEVNVRIDRHLVDFLWRDWKLVVETDGYRYHSGRAAFEDDRTTDLALRALGYQVVRLADSQLEREPGRIADLLREVAA